VTAFDRHPVRNTLILVAADLAIIVVIASAVTAAGSKAPLVHTSPSPLVTAPPAVSGSPASPSPAATLAATARPSRRAAVRTTRPVAPVTVVATSATAPAPRPATTMPPPATTTAPAPSCTPLTNAGNCYEPGEFCRDADHGVTGVAGDGESITCENVDGWRWEPA
jgi:hypothetical protein